MNHYLTNKEQKDLIKQILEEFENIRSFLSGLAFLDRQNHLPPVDDTASMQFEDLSESIREDLFRLSRSLYATKKQGGQ